MEEEGVSVHMENKEKPSKKAKKGLGILLGTAAILVASAAIAFPLLQSNEEQVKELDKETLLKESIQLVYDGEFQDSDDKETPFHYLLFYKIEDKHDLFDENMVYSYTLDNFTSQFVTNTYRKVDVDGEEVYVLLPEEDGEEVVTDQEGISKEEVLKENPSSIIIGEGFPTKGELILKESEPISEDLDILENLNYAIYLNFDFPEK